MKRGLLIAALVLVPFTALVAFGFSLMKDPPPIELPAVQVQLPPPVPIEPERPLPPLRPALRVDVPVIAPPMPAPMEPEPPAPAPPRELSAKAKRVPMIAAVEPLVHQCFADLSDRVHERMEAIVTFNPTAIGGFENVTIKKVSWPDPQLAACILDSFEEARFEPGGLVLRRQTHTFTFDVPDAGR